MKTRYYIVWIEGLSWFDGEKIKTITPDHIEYTTKVTEALRVKGKDLECMRRWLKGIGVADWCINSDTLFIPTNYVPGGTLWRK